MVSIIIAAYNIELYIKRCIESIINQSFTDIEIIVVNDGSTDKTLDFIVGESQKDKRIKVINKRNEGLIEARKSGFEKASGEYILFVDGDDWIDKDTVKILYEKAISKDYDIVGFKYYKVYKNGEKKQSVEESFEFIEGDYFLKLCLLGKIKHELCTKFIKRKFITENNIEFPTNISYAEDLAFTNNLSIYKPKACILENHLYFYYQREDSLTNIFSNKRLEIKKATLFVKNNLIKNNLLDKFKEEYEYMAFIHNYYVFKNYIFMSNNKLGKQLFKSWRELEVNITSKNKYYKNIYLNECTKAKVLARICERSYLVGKLIYKKL